MQTFQTELIYSRPEGRASGSGIVPPESFEALEAQRTRHGVETEWFFDSDPETGEQRHAFTPIEGGRLALIEERGIQHGERFLATFEVKEVRRHAGSQTQLWLIDAQPV